MPVKSLVLIPFADSSLLLFFILMEYPSNDRTEETDPKKKSYIPIGELIHPTNFPLKLKISRNFFLLSRRSRLATTKMVYIINHHMIASCAPPTKKCVSSSMFIIKQFSQHILLLLLVLLLLLLLLLESAHNTSYDFHHCLRNNRMSQHASRVKRLSKQLVALL